MSVLVTRYDYRFRIILFLIFAEILTKKRIFILNSPSMLKFVFCYHRAKTGHPNRVGRTHKVICLSLVPAHGLRIAILWFYCLLLIAHFHQGLTMLSDSKGSDYLLLIVRSDFEKYLCVFLMCITKLISMFLI